MPLKDKAIMISGASRGLGAALARRLSEEGAAVSLCARGAKELERLREELESSGARCLAVPTDVSDELQVARWVEETVDAFGRVDGLVNNASLLGPRVPIRDYPLDEWRQVLEVNLTGAFVCARAVLEPLQASRGALVNVSSGVGDHGRPLWGAYSVSKNGVEALTDILAGELREAGVRVNTVDPGAMRTEMRAAAYPEEDPMTLRTPYEVADVFVYLLSDLSKDVTGERFRAQEFELSAHQS